MTDEEFAGLMDELQQQKAGAQKEWQQEQMWGSLMNLGRVVIPILPYFVVLIIAFLITA